MAADELPAEVRELVSGLGERVYLGAALAPGEKHAVSLLAAPTFDAEGRQELVLTMYVGKAVTGAEIARCGRTLVEAADAMTAEAGRPETLTAARVERGTRRRERGTQAWEGGTNRGGVGAQGAGWAQRFAVSRRLGRSFSDSIIS
jgi:hypothetical protein